MPWHRICNNDNFQRSQRCYSQSTGEEGRGFAGMPIKKGNCGDIQLWSTYGACFYCRFPASTAFLLSSTHCEFSSLKIHLEEALLLPPTGFPFVSFSLHTLKDFSLHSALMRYSPILISAATSLSKCLWLQPIPHLFRLKISPSQFGHINDSSYVQVIPEIHA